MNTGPKSKFGEEGFENELLKWIFEEREKGFAVSNISILINACSLSRNFKAKMFQAQYSVIERFVKKYILVYQLGTSEWQCTKQEVNKEARPWLEDVQNKLKQPQYS